jgi:hypothetical protein
MAYNFLTSDAFQSGRLVYICHIERRQTTKDNILRPRPMRSSNTIHEYTLRFPYTQ